ncbi:hypothetical protein OPV22_027411 [Ensete ventricosum]|uniref:Uncharacterized protein n=1 Tax=Ensete ventricosum TaxID=4639 RepID=A0AAV8Q7J8_ENSVE|nr:hypothetical protein OPV22_027411 [Ensete ventricosum]
MWLCSPVHGARMIHPFVPVSIISPPKPCGGWPTQHHEAVSWCIVPSALGRISCSPETTSRAEYSPHALISENSVFAASTFPPLQRHAKVVSRDMITLVLCCFGDCHGWCG